jgi:hypothetical protein
MKEIDEGKMLLLHEDGLSDREIAKSLGIHHSSVAHHRRLYELEPNGQGPRKFQWVNAKSGRCTKCSRIKNIDRFKVVRKNPNPYRLSYCSVCLARQVMNKVNSNVEIYLRRAWKKIQSNSRRKHETFNLSWSHFKKLYFDQKGLCFYTDLPMVCKLGRGLRGDAFSVDRVEAVKGYTRGNTVFCRARINSCKNNLTLAEMKKYTPDWYKRILRFKGNF